ncbi:MAG TPA: LytTR family DNA-binding domain-containing protein [Chryseolinea sp.]|nr:LytTR family DNA-binding domain-containing protein [Chryseolinea sp.]
MNVVPWLRQPFRLLDSARSRWMLIIFCGIFGCLFLNIFKPFNINQWFNDVNTPLFIVLTFFCVAGMAALALTQVTLRGIFKLQLTTRIGFVAWLLVDFFFISLAVHTVDILLLDIAFFDLPEYLENLKHTFLVLMLPYFVGILLLYLRQQLQVVKELTLKVNKPSNLADSVTINDENGKAAVNMPLRNIVYFKSEDNYILLYYKHENELKKELIRTTLKNLEQDLSQPNFVRIHRSYMINSQNLLSAIKTSKGYRVKMDAESQHHLPVSATYQRAFEEKVVEL